MNNEVQNSNYLMEDEVRRPQSPLLAYNIVIEFPQERRYRLEETVMELENGPPHYPLVYLKSELTGEKFEIFQWFRSSVSKCLTSKNPDVIVSMCDVFSRCRTALSIPLKEYILMDGLVSTCFRLQVQDSDIVNRVLQIIYSSWQTLGPLHFRGILRPLKIDKKELEERKAQHLKTRDYISFFLYHATVQKLKFDGVRMVDVSIYSSLFKAPIVVASDVWSSKAVLRYLQYGARLEDLSIDSSRSRSGLSSGLVDTLRLMIQYLYFRVVHPSYDTEVNTSNLAQYCATLDKEAKELCMTVIYILRAVKSIPYKSLKFTFECFTRVDGLQEVESMLILSNEVVDFMIPTLRLRYECVPNLKHCCRWTIRRRLNENFQLPYGIDLLPLPKRLKKYLNILLD